MSPIQSICACPFCAAANAHPLEVDADGWALVCGSCGAIGPIGQSEAKAVLLWNNRSTHYQSVFVDKDGKSDE